MTACSYCFIFVEYCNKKAMLYKMQRGKWKALKTATKQTWPACFCGRFIDKEMLLAMNFGGRSILQRKIEAIWTISFKIRTKIEGREHLYCVSLRRRFFFLSAASAICSSKCDEMRLNFAFYCQNFACFSEIYLWMHVTARLASKWCLK